MAFCTKCGAELLQGAVFCGKCGSAVAGSAAGGLVQEPAVGAGSAATTGEGAGTAQPAPVSQTVASGAQAGPAHAARGSGSAAPASSGKPPAKVIAAVVAALAAVGVVAALFLSGILGGHGDNSAPSPEPAAGDDAAIAQSEEPAEVENMPVPDFSQLFKMNREEAAEYLAAYPHDDYYGNGEVPLDGGTFGSTQAIADDVNWFYSGDKVEPGNWSMSLYWPEESETCGNVYFQMTPLSTSDEELVSSQEYAEMLEEYFADSDIHELTVAKEDYEAGRPDWGGGPYFCGYMLFDDVAAELNGNVGTGYGITIYPCADPEHGSDWEDTKEMIDVGYYEDVHSGGITYEIPIIDVYTATGDGGSADEGSDETAAGQVPEKGMSFVVGFDQEYPPFGYVGDDEEYTGFDLELAEEVCARNGWNYVPMPIDWDTKLDDLNAGTYSCVWSAFVAEGREADYALSEPYLSYQGETYVVAFKKGNEELADAVTATLREMTEDGFVEQLCGKYADDGISFDSWMLKGPSSGSEGSGEAGSETTSEAAASTDHDIVTADFVADIPESWEGWVRIETYDDDSGSHAVIYPDVSLAGDGQFFLARIDSVASDEPYNAGDYVTHKIARIEDKGKTVDVTSVNWAAHYGEVFFQSPYYSGPSQEEEFMAYAVALSTGEVENISMVKEKATSASEMTDVVQAFEGLDYDFLTAEFVPTIETVG